MDLLIAEFGVPDELTLMFYVEAWFAELDRYAEVPLFEDGRTSGRRLPEKTFSGELLYRHQCRGRAATPELAGLDGLAEKCQG
jgi:hypothetical protein